jgi:hypothetical protein
VRNVLGYVCGLGLHKTLGEGCGGVQETELVGNAQSEVEVCVRGRFIVTWCCCKGERSEMRF